MRTRRDARFWSRRRDAARVFAKRKNGERASRFGEEKTAARVDEKRARGRLGKKLEICPPSARERVPARREQEGLVTDVARLAFFRGKKGPMRKSRARARRATERKETHLVRRERGDPSRGLPRPRVPRVHAPVPPPHHRTRAPSARTARLATAFGASKLCVHAPESASQRFSVLSSPPLQTASGLSHPTQVTPPRWSPSTSSAPRGARGPSADSVASKSRHDLAGAAPGTCDATRPFRAFRRLRLARG